MLLLVAAGVLSFSFGDVPEGVAICVVILLNALIGFLTEVRAIKSMEALRRLGTVSTRVRRESDEFEIDAEELVLGDVVLLEAGDVITADLRLVACSRLQVDESPLTGESMPVQKSPAPVAPDTVLAERSCMLYKGTSLTLGSCEAVVVSTGMNTELGRIYSLVEQAEKTATPLEKRLEKLGRRLIVATGVIGLVIVGMGAAAGKETLLMIETAIALSVAAIPEGLPVVATIALARGMLRMARRNALVRNLSAVETLGSTGVICTDKTGTLTENRMTATVAVVGGGSRFDLSEHEQWGDEDDGGPLSDLRRMLEVAVLCNNAALPHPGSGQDGVAVGDPTEIALLEAARTSGIEKHDMHSRFPERREVPFDSTTKLMATFHQTASGFTAAVKGAPEAVLSVCSMHGPVPFLEEEKEEWRERSAQLASHGLRVLAFASRQVTSPDVEAYRDLSFLGLIAMADPPRRDVRTSIDLCQEAGIRVIMVTGDQPLTARSIAISVGLTDDPDEKVVHGSDVGSIDDLSPDERENLIRLNIFSRVSPEQKLDIIELHQQNGSVVAMTGDGVNDAPALKKADIGVAMGRRGTQVAREAADMVLKDDAFSTIVDAVAQGRAIFSNIRRFVFYLMSCNVSEIMAVSLAAMVNAPLPILPLQILFLNLVTDVFPALALGVGKGEASLMRAPPRDPREPILRKPQWMGIAGFGMLITVATLASLAAAVRLLGMEPEEAVTISFLTLAFAQLWHVFNMRDRSSGLLRNQITSNPMVWIAIAVCIGLIFLALYVPALASVLQLTAPGGSGWAMVAGFSLLPLLLGQLWLVLRSVPRE